MIDGSNNVVSTVTQGLPMLLSSVSELRKNTSVGSCGVKPILNTRGQKTAWEECVRKHQAGGGVDPTKKRLQNIALIITGSIIVTVVLIIVIKRNR